MDNLMRFETISQFNAYTNHKTLHPLVTVVDYSKADLSNLTRIYFGFYNIILKDVRCGDIQYGKETYDYQEGTLVFYAPGQIIGVDSAEEYYQPSGHGLAFHPDLIHGTALGRHMGDYTFFSYQTREALHLSEDEKVLVIDCFAKIQYELKQAIDKHSKQLIVSNVELFLNYCRRFYDRQFITREKVNRGCLATFEKLLDDYFQTDKPQAIGLPSVAYCADAMNLSPNYFGDLIKKETGRTAQEHIQAKLIEVAKERIFDTTKSVSEIAYEMGFKYPTHFARFFKQQMGRTPREYRDQLN